MATELECLERVKLLIGDNDTLATIRFFLDDNFLLKFCTYVNFDPEKAFQLTRLCSYDNFIAKIIPTSLPLLEEKITGYLRGKDALGRSIIVDRLGRWDDSKCSFDELLKTSHLIIEDIIRECEGVSDLGVVSIKDLNGLKWRYVKYGTPKHLRKLLDLTVRHLPIQIGAIHLVNVHPLFVPFIALARRLAPEIEYELYVHSEVKGLHSHIPKAILPECYGGDLDEDAAFDFTLLDRIRGKNDVYEKLYKSVTM